VADEGRSSGGVGFQPCWVGGGDGDRVSSFLVGFLLFQPGKTARRGRTMLAQIFLFVSAF
jgi:hypothetical protein